MQFGSLVYLQTVAEIYEDIIEVDKERDDEGFAMLKIVVKPTYNVDAIKDFLENHVPMGVECNIVVQENEVETMNENETDLEKYISDKIDEYITDEKLKQLGYTKETFKNSELRLLFQSMMLSMEKAIQDETARLMKENSLSYGEARILATKIVRNSFEIGMKSEGGKQ